LHIFTTNTHLSITPLYHNCIFTYTGSSTADTCSVGAGREYSTTVIWQHTPT